MSELEWVDNLSITSGKNIPIATQLANQLYWLIASRSLKPNDKLPPIRTLASELGINLHTVRSSYEKLETMGLIETKQSRGSFIKTFNPIEHYNRFSNFTTNTIAVLIPDLKSPFYAEFLTGVDKIAREERFITIVFNTQESDNLESEIDINALTFDMIIAKGIDGLIVGPGKLSLGRVKKTVNEPYLSQLPCPVVFIDRPEIDSYVVNLDAENAGKEAMEHLISHGHKDIALITGNPLQPTLKNCYNGYLKSLENYSIPYNEKLIKKVKYFTALEGYKSCLDLLQARANGLDFTAIFVAGDILAIGALKALREYNLSVPEDIAIVGYNNIDICKYTYPSLSTVAAPIQEMGIESARMLINRIKQKPIENNNIVLPTKLIIRKSCGCVAKNKS